MRAILLLSACTAANPSFSRSDLGRAPALAPASVAEPEELAPARDLGQPHDLAGADLTKRSPSDLAPPAADLADLAKPSDLASAAVADLAPAPSCGDVAQPCCGSDCKSGLICMRNGDQCGGGTSACVPAGNCGGPALPCCSQLGQPMSIGYCREDVRCVSGSCRPC